MQYLINNKGQWSHGEPKEGDIVRFTDEAGGLVETFYSPCFEHSERLWRNSELSRTDRFQTLEDFPYKEKLLEYRQSLRDYTFSGKRPQVPINEKGNYIC